MLANFESVNWVLVTWEDGVSAIFVDVAIGVIATSTKIADGL